MTVDLHSHTTISDGSLDPGELVHAAAKAGIEVLAVTDHDTVEAIDECLAAGEREGVRIVPGIEISSWIGDPPRDLHVLAYFARERIDGLRAWQAERRRAREERLDHVLARLAELGFPLRRDEVTGPSPDPRRSIGRPHVARALIARGYCADQREAFDRFLGQGKPAYVEYPRPDVPEVCALVRRLAGIPVVAHPKLDGLEPLLETLKESGIEGVEVFHPDQPVDVAQRLLAKARALELYATGGSDYHGGRKNEGGALGSTGCPRDHWERLAAALERKAKETP